MCSDFESQIEADQKMHRMAQIESQRARNPFRLTDAGMLWLIWIPLVVLVIGVARVLGELNYLRMAEIYLP